MDAKIELLSNIGASMCVWGGVLYNVRRPDLLRVTCRFDLARRVRPTRSWSIAGSHFQAFALGPATHVRHWHWAYFAVDLLLGVFHGGSVEFLILFSSASDVHNP